MGLFGATHLATLLRRSGGGGETGRHSVLLVSKVGIGCNNSARCSTRGDAPCRASCAGQGVTLFDTGIVRQPLRLRSHRGVLGARRRDMCGDAKFGGNGRVDVKPARARYLMKAVEEAEAAAHRLLDLYHFTSPTPARRTRRRCARRESRRQVKVN